MTKEDNIQVIINNLGLNPADYHKKSIIEKYLGNFLEKEKNYPRKEDFTRSIMMALYVLDGIKDPNKIIIVDRPAFTYEKEFYSISTHQTSWQGNIDQLRILKENGILHLKIKEFIDEFNSNDITKIFIYELFSNIVKRNDIETYDPHVEIKFLSKFLVEKKDEGIKLLESNGL